MNSSIKERPIPFSGDMVRALIREYQHPGRYKTQTRRTKGLQRFNCFPSVLKEKGWEIQEFIEEEPGLWLAISNDESGEFPDMFDPWIKCPYGKMGDHLWVRESIWNDSDFSWLYSADDVYLPMEYPEGWASKVAHKRSIPLIHMPRWAAHILLEITEIKIERLQEITWSDARKEGIEHIIVDEYDFQGLWRDYTGKSGGFRSEIDSFFSLWETIKDPGSVALNPWVWVVEFKVLTIDGEIK